MKQENGLSVGAGGPQGAYRDEENSGDGEDTRAVRTLIDGRLGTGLTARVPRIDECCGFDGLYPQLDVTAPRSDVHRLREGSVPGYS